MTVQLQKLKDALVEERKHVQNASCAYCVLDPWELYSHLDRTSVFLPSFRDVPPKSAPYTNQRLCHRVLVSPGALYEQSISSNDRNYGQS